MWTKYDFDSDGTTVSDIGEVGNISDVSVPDEVLEMCTERDFDSDGPTISDVGERDNMSDVSVPDEVLEKCTKSDFDSNGLTISDVDEQDNISDISVPDEVLEMCSKYDFDSDGTTISDVGEEDDNDFSQWTDSMDAFAATFVLAAETSASTVGTGRDVSQRISDGIETTSMSESTVCTPRRSSAGASTVGNTASPSPAKRRLAATSDTFQEPPSSRQRQNLSDAAQTELSPLRKTLLSTLSLRSS